MTRSLPNQKYIVCLFLCLLFPGLPIAANPLGVMHADKESYLAFVENKGQIAYGNGTSAPEVLFTASSGSTTIYFTTRGISYVSAAIPDSAFNFMKNGNLHSPSGLSIRLSRIDMQLIGADDNCIVSGAEPLEGYYNYYTASIPGGINNVKKFKKIIYTNVYSNIDLVFHCSPDNRGVKYDFIVHPGGDPSDIKISYKGIDKLGKKKSGSILLSNSVASIAEEKPYAYQLLDKTGKDGATARKTVKCDFSISGDILTFKTGNFNRTQDLIIDPLVLWSTYYGGNSSDHSYAVTTDKDGSIIMSGITLSTDLPATPGTFSQTFNRFFDAFVSKFDRIGNHVWTTYYGSNEADYCYAVAADLNSDIFIGGWTWGSAFPVSDNAFQPFFNGGEADGFIVKLTGSGQRLWATYYGGESSDHMYGVAADSSGSIAVTGWTRSTTLSVDSLAFQISNEGKEDAYITRFDGQGNFLWGTYFGGDSTESGQGVSIDQMGNIVIAGYTSSYNLPVKGNPAQLTLNNGYDVFVAKFDTTGMLLLSTYFGGSNDDYGYGMATDASSNIVVTGTTYSNDFPLKGSPVQTTFGGQQDALLIKFSSSGSILYSSYLGGWDIDIGNAIATDRVNEIVVAGYTESPDYPVTPQAFQTTLSDTSDAFLSKFNSDGSSLQWSTYFGGIRNDWGNAVCTDADKSIYLAGDSESDDLYVSPGAFQTIKGRFIDGFLAKFCPSAPRPVISAVKGTSLCAGDTALLDAGSDYRSYLWSTGATTRSIKVTTPGEYWVLVTDSNVCEGRSPNITITFFPKVVPEIVGDNVFCKGDSSVLTVEGDYDSYTWSNGETGKSIIAKKADRYIVTVVDANGCKGSDTVDVTVNLLPMPKIIGQASVCAFSRKNYRVSGIAYHNYNWTVSGGIIANNDDPMEIVIDWNGSGTGIITVENINPRTGCIGYDTFYVKISDKLEPDIVSNKENFSICQGDSLELDAGTGYYSYLWSSGSSSQTISVRDSGTYSVLVSDASGCVGRDTVRVSVYGIPSPSISGQQIVCLGSSDEVYSTASNTGNSYDWLVTGGTIVEGNGTNSIRIEWSSTGTHSIDLVETIDATGCYASAETFNVQVMPLPDPDILSSSDTVFCEGDSTVLDAGDGFASYFWSTGQTSRKIVARQSGLYIVSVTSEYGCSAVDSIGVTVYPNPEKPVISESNDTLYSTPGYIYQWYRNGTSINGANDRSYIPASESNYTVMVYNENDCYTMSDPYNFHFKQAEATISLSDTLWAESGEEVVMPIVISKSSNLSRTGVKNYILRLSYNGSMLTLKDQNHNISKSGRNNIIQLNGTLRDTIGKIGEIRFIAALGALPCSQISIDTVIWRESFVKTTLDTTVFCLEDLCIAGGTRLFIPYGRLHMKPNYPNPFTDVTNIEFELSESGLTRLYVMDPLGKVITTVYETSESGIHKTTFDGSGLPSGIYIFVLETPTQKLINKFEIIR